MVRTCHPAGNATSVAYLVAARQILEDVQEVEAQAAGEYRLPRGALGLTAPIVFGSKCPYPTPISDLRCALQPGAVPGADTASPGPWGVRQPYDLVSATDCSIIHLNARTNRSWLRSRGQVREVVRWVVSRFV